VVLVTIWVGGWANEGPSSANVEQSTRQEQYQAALQAARLEALGPAKSANCPGNEPALRTIGPSWEPVNEKNPDALCDFVFNIVLGDIKTDGPGGGYAPKAGATGRTSTKIVTKVKAVGDKAVISYTLCPAGTGPEDGTARCKSYEQAGVTREAGLTIGLKGKVGVYYK
jgi:hypothetical protein